MEDEFSVRPLARQILCSVGYRLLEASDVRSAMKLIAFHGPEVDLLIIDIVIRHGGAAAVAWATDP